MKNQKQKFQNIDHNRVIAVATDISREEIVNNIGQSAGELIRFKKLNSRKP